MDKGLYYFEAMIRCYGLTPRLEHCGCMVDLLGWANLLVEAVKFIMSFPIRSDVVMWRSLLFACKSHGNVELAEFAANKIEELEPRKYGARVLLSNVYASASRWSDVKCVKWVRKNMFTHGTQKQPGCSLVEVNGLVSEFFVSDSSHPQINDISERIFGINKILQPDSFDSNILDYEEQWGGV
ncbi:Pentatricopeptide repeat-containing protein [Camellia lanceoleosa]|uniref:Pentatricopeptide repeat-containing protein n=1 Tax=Camellia lanceoleosa TaxID=1840588 RepID=A0ACC0G2V6_9ERIC|nr:Pentatricopeptide repeat-containing protein [Camellia lanceoleosa]